MLLARPPSLRLLPFISELWASGGFRQGRHFEERVLPSGDMHVVIRLCGSPVRIMSHPHDRIGQTISTAVVGGARASAYVKLMEDHSPTVGFTLRPGGAHQLLGVPGCEFAGRHTGLEDIWPASFIANLCDQMLELAQPLDQLAVLERFLEHHIVYRSGPDAMISVMASKLRRGISIGTIVSEIGHSHRHLASSFASQTGLTPKLYQRVNRFSRMLKELHRAREVTIADLSVQFGYSDQAHLTGISASLLA